MRFFYWRFIIAMLLMAICAKSAAAQDKLAPPSPVAQGLMDTFYLGAGTANISQANSLSLGFLVLGGLELGFWDYYFGEIGYGTFMTTYDREVAGVKYTQDFRTTGPHIAIGAIFPVREQNIGFRLQVHPANQYDLSLKGKTGGTVESRSGAINIISAYIFTRRRYIHEIGFRVDSFSSNKADVSGNYGVYYMYHFR